jgi:hypothetical protein
MARTVVSILLVGLAGCQSIALSLVGAGAGTALRYGFDGVAYRTFTAPASAVKDASLNALELMGIVLDSTGSFEGGELIFAHSDTRKIEIEVESISARATRVRIAAKNGACSTTRRPPRKSSPRPSSCSAPAQQMLAL